MNADHSFPQCALEPRANPFCPGSSYSKIILRDDLLFHCLFVVGTEEGVCVIEDGPILERSKKYLSVN